MLKLYDRSFSLMTLSYLRCKENGPFDFFLPSPSLSITSSAHLILRLLAGSPRSLSVPDGLIPGCCGSGAASV